MNEQTSRVPHAPRNALVCAVLLAFCALLIYPVLEMGTNDDWSYARTALEFARTGHIVYNGWASMMLGWQVIWGALFIKLFGFSFLALRVSTLIVAMAATYLLYLILVRFGVSAPSAGIGTLTVALSPIFLPLATNFMSDVPGLFCILLCLYLCQRALAATSSRAAVGWLWAATGTNLLGGTVRQIVWLGVLLMIPSAGWLLRKQRGIPVAVAVQWLLGVAWIAACMYWYKQQPYSVPEKLIDGPVTGAVLRHLAGQILRTILSILLFGLPVLGAWAGVMRRTTRRARGVAVGCAVAVLALLALSWRRGTLIDWVPPWLGNLVTPNGIMRDQELLGAKTIVLHGAVRLGLLFVIAAVTITLISSIASRLPRRFPIPSGQFTWTQTGILLGPFTLAYLALLMPRGAFFTIFDRYLLIPLVVFVIVTLRYYTERIGPKLPVMSAVLLLPLTMYAVSTSHDQFAQDRARLQAADALRASGVPRTGMDVGFEYDGWTQLEAGGHINSPQIELPAGAYHPVAHGSTTAQPCRFWYLDYTPVVHPAYMVTFQPMPCLAPSRFPPVEYRTWLPPFHRTLYIEQPLAASGEPAPVQ